MKYIQILAWVFALSGAAFAADHGPIFGYATPVNSEREFSFDTGIFGRNGSQGTQFSTVYPTVLLARSTPVFMPLSHSIAYKHG